MKLKIQKIKRGRHAGQWRFAIVAANGELIDPRQPYNSKQSVLEAVALLRGLKDVELVVEE